MKRTNNILILFTGLLLHIAYISMAQEDTLVVPPGSVAEKLANRSFSDKGILLKQEFTGGVMLHTHGWGINLRRSKNKTYKRKRVIELDITSMKHAKELKISNLYNDSYEPFVYGRTYQLLVSRLGYGRQNVMFQRFDQGIEIRYLYIFGFASGWAKPVYLEISESGGPPGQYERVSTERYDPNNPDHSIDHILGSSTFFKGLGELKVHPGIYGKLGISFDYAKKERSINTIEAGVIVDAYLKVVEQMAFAKNNQVFVNLYISLNFGTKWYKL